MLHASEIGVTAKDGMVTLTGTVDSYFKKITAENVAKNVTGVQAVAKKVEIGIGNVLTADDAENIKSNEYFKINNKIEVLQLPLY